MTRTPLRCLTKLAGSALGAFLLLAPASAQVRAPSNAPLGPGLSCTVFGPDRVCASDGAVNYLAQVSPNLPGTTYAWTLHSTTTDGCPGTGTTTPSFCGPTNLPTVCVNPGTNPGRFVVKVVITDGAATSTCCLSVNVRPPTFTSTPPPASVCEGTTHTFCTTASGGGPYTYSWTKNGAVIPGATDSCYTATAGPAGVIDNYCVTTTGSGLCAVSYTACALLTALPRTSVAALPTPRRCEGQTFQFCATVNGAGPFTYSWAKNGVAIPGATDVCYTATAGAPLTVDTYCITVTGACGPAVVRCGTLTARLNTVTSALVGASLCEGLTHQFCTTAGGTGPFTYSWTKNGADIPGATANCYTATAGLGGSVDTYCVKVVGACGETSSCATLTSNPNVTATEVQGATVCAGTTLQFCTTAGGTGPFTYSWTKNAVAIPGATDSCYSATAGVGGTVDTYCVNVTGSCGSVTRCATLTATINVTATDLQPGTVCGGLTWQFCTTAGGTGPFTYGWTKNGAAIPGATDNCYTATAGAGGTADTYCVTVSGACGAPVQRCATLTSLSGDVTATPMAPRAICTGTTAQFCTTAGGTGPFTYIWTKNGSAIPGATDSCYTATAGPPTTVDQYCVTVTGACGSAVRCVMLRAQGNTTATIMADAYVCPGFSHTFCTAPGGVGPWTFSWTRNGVLVPGATTNCYSATAGALDSEIICVTVTGQCGPSVTQCATLFRNAPTTVVPIGSATVCEGTTHTFCAAPGGTGPFTWSWSKNFVAIPGATNSCYTATAPMASSPPDTYCVKVFGACTLEVSCGTLTGIPCSGAFLTFDPSEFGDANAQHNGVDMGTLVSGLLQSDLSVGQVGLNSLTVPGSTGAEDCLIDLLRTTGTMGILPAFGDAALDPSQCQTSPIPIPVVNGQFESLLLAQLVTTSLNVRFNEGVTDAGGCTTTSAGLAEMGLCSTMVSRTLLPGVDGCMGTADDVPDLMGPDGNPETPDNLVTVTIPAGVLAALNQLTESGQITKGQTVGGLVELANRAVAGGDTWTAALQDISASLDAVTVLYHRGRETVDCWNP